MALDKEVVPTPIWLLLYTFDVFLERQAVAYSFTILNILGYQVYTVQYICQRRQYSSMEDGLYTTLYK